MNTLPLLLKREYWEHRGGFLWTPVWISVALLVIVLLGIVSAEVLSARADVHLGFSLGDLREQISTSDFAEAGNAFDLIQLTFAAMACIGLFFVLFFYLLGALYDDRRDRSVLFWKSLPVSDVQTVVSKAVSAMLVAPLIALVVTTLAYLVFLLLVVLWLGAHGVNALPAVLAAHPAGLFGRLLLIVPVNALWALPTIGWLLLWSAFARSKPFLWAVLLPVLALVMNGWFGSLVLPHVGTGPMLRDVVGRLLLSVAPGSWLGSAAATVGAAKVRFNVDDKHVLNSFDPGNIYGVLATPGLWIGVVAGLLMVALAVWLRGRRIETAV